MWTLVSIAFAADPRELVAPLGVDRLQEVGELRFTFVVERDGVAKARRAWAWRPATGAVTRTIDGETLTFRMGAPTNDAEKQADAQFVNDSFWLLPQLHVRWAGADLTVVDHGAAPLPIGEGTARKVELRYAPDGGGYTPGDAYDLFLDPSGRIVAWTYREDGKPEPSLSTTFEAYTKVGPLEIATEHRTADGAFVLRFTDLAVAP